VAYLVLLLAEFAHAGVKKRAQHVRPDRSFEDACLGIPAGHNVAAGSRIGWGYGQLYERDKRGWRLVGGGRPIDDDDEPL
jgi:hypothetical protein